MNLKGGLEVPGGKILRVRGHSDTNFLVWSVGARIQIEIFQSEYLKSSKMD